jgi:hypothetical protein
MMSGKLMSLPVETIKRPSCPNLKEFFEEVKFNARMNFMRADEVPNCFFLLSKEIDGSTMSIVPCFWEDDREGGRARVHQGDVCHEERRR